MEDIVIVRVCFGPLAGTKLSCGFPSAVLLLLRRRRRKEIPRVGLRFVSAWAHSQPFT